jgi:hypothetical protein
MVATSLGPGGPCARGCLRPTLSTCSRLTRRAGLPAGTAGKALLGIPHTSCGGGPGPGGGLRWGGGTVLAV